jgi:sterol desaturase/sphingolipid hydroxylase (fatty acid hydroxylase superfamily)
MAEYVIAHEPALRLAAFLVSVAAMAAWESLAPRRRRPLGRLTRWPANIAIVVTNTLLLRLVFPVAAVGASLWAAEIGFGLFQWFAAPAWAAIAVSVVALDLVIYGQHAVFHRVPLLWRLHRMHHKDLDVDFTTGLRFHPVEIVISAAIRFAAVMILGAPAVAVILLEVILNSSSLFNHGNIRLGAADRVLRLLIVTPDMHRIHHSVIASETNSNYGFALSVWDRLFGTYRARPARGHDAMTLGLPLFRAPGDRGYLSLLLSPLR